MCVEQVESVAGLVMAAGIVETIGRYLPTRWRGRNAVMGKWEQIEPALEQYITKAGHVVDDGGTEETGGKYPRLMQLMLKQEPNRPNESRTS